MFRFALFVVSGVLKVLVIITLGLIAVGYSADAVAEVKKNYLPMIIDAVENYRSQSL